MPKMIDISSSETEENLEEYEFDTSEYIKLPGTSKYEELEKELELVKSWVKHHQKSVELSFEREHKYKESAQKLYKVLFDCIDKFPCNHKYSPECTACQAEDVLNRESYLNIKDKKDG